MNTNQDITIYIRKVDKKGIKIIINKNQPITSSGFYRLLLHKPDFIKFINDQLRPIINLINPTLQLQQTLFEVIELYYEGNLINKHDNDTPLKFRNLSIVHVIVKKITQTQHNQPIKTQQTQKSNNPQQKQSQQSSQQKQAAKIQKQKQTLLNIKILCSKNCTIINEQKTISKYVDQMVISENRVLKFEQRQMKVRSVYQSLKDINVRQIRQKIQNVNDQMNRIQKRKVELVGFKVKVIHMGKVIQLVFDENNNQQLNQNETYPNNINIKWSQLNIFPNSQIIVLISFIEVNQTVLIKQQSSLQIDNYIEVNQTISIKQQSPLQIVDYKQQVVDYKQQVVDYKQQNVIDSNKNQQNQNQQNQENNKEESIETKLNTFNIQQTLIENYTQNNFKEKSLYLQLQNVLTLRLYQGYKTYNSTQWKYQNHYIQQLQPIVIINNQREQNMQYKLTKTLHKNRNPYQLNNQIKLCYEFDPFIQQYQFYQQKQNKQLNYQQNRNQIKENSLINDQIDLVNSIDMNVMSQQQVKQKQKQQSLSQHMNSEMSSKQTDEASNNQRLKGRIVEQQQKKTPSILTY